MHCASCQSRVQRSLAEQAGVVDASVNLILNTAAVTFDPTATTPERLVQAIRETGYDSEVPGSANTAFEEQAARDRAIDEEFRGLRLKAMVSGIAAVVAMILSLPLMAPAAAGHETVVADPFMRWVMHSLSPVLQSAVPLALHAASAGSGLRAVTSDGQCHALGRAAVLCPGLDCVPASHRGHEHAHRIGHRSGVRVFLPGGAYAAVLPRARVSHPIRISRPLSSSSH